VNSGSGWNVRESVEFNLQRGDKDQVYKTVSWPLPLESPAGRRPAIPSLAIGERAIARSGAVPKLIEATTADVSNL
jgi:hypothetical protein